MQLHQPSDAVVCLVSAPAFLQGEQDGHIGRAWLGAAAARSCTGTGRRRLDGGGRSLTVAVQLLPAETFRDASLNPLSSEAVTP